MARNLNFFLPSHNYTILFYRIFQVFNFTNWQKESLEFFDFSKEKLMNAQGESFSSYSSV